MEVIPPAPARYFNDYAGVVSARVVNELNSKLEQFERDSSSQLRVAIFSKMQSDSSIEDYTFRVKEAIGEAELCVSDNGRGMGPTRPGSQGLRLVESLSRQLGGRVTTPEAPKGTTTVLTFPYSI